MQSMEGEGYALPLKVLQRGDFMNYFKQAIRLSCCLILGSLLLTASGCKHPISKDSTGDVPVPSVTVDPSQTPAPTKVSNNPIVTMEFKDFGTVKIELYPDVAPNTVNNFISLVNKGFYDGLTIHRIVPGFVIQGGDPLGNGTGNPGYVIKGEFTSNGFTNNLKHTRGVISMARRAQPMDSAGSQFFIMLQNNDSLNGDYAAFGKVIEGMDVVDKIAAVERGENQRPINPPVIKKATVETFGITYPEPEVIPVTQ
jgi:peptidyl-prolyl cis-trans isomerase B (cyclophilin B)